MVRRILVGLDGSPLAETILGSARALARRLGAELVLLHVTHVPQTVRVVAPGPTLDEIVAQERVRAKGYLERVARSIGEGGLAVRTVVRVGEAAAEIVGYAERERVDLIALATHGRSGMQRWLYGSVADGVLHTSTAPLLLLRTGAEAASSYPFRRVVVPLDGSHLSESALALAEELARALAVPIVLLRVIEFVGLAFAADPVASSYVDYQRILDTLQEDAEQYLASVASGLREKGLEVETLAQVGVAPVDTITRHAREHPGSLLVLSTHGRTGWRAVVLGSVARRVALLADGPVLMVRPTVATGGTGEAKA
jgi:nucleotide-binding universal stress UspA family protein